MVWGQDITHFLTASATISSCFLLGRFIYQKKFQEQTITDKINSILNITELFLIYKIGKLIVHHV